MMKAKYFLGHAIDGYAFIGRKGSATNRKKEPNPVSTIAPMTLPEAKKLLKHFDKNLLSSGMKIFELVKVK